ncbi:antitoxin VapB [Sphingomonas jinjuensis]|uniref:Antitoxin VapB n=1 Tax=Sphingomonas jinjuensis TaxID=535907 RepID=A0A840F8T4_9SPHN|nr:AbrB/MazE/SpoVT family DNA-binding domain-containing protein [Sphingomonas jinjuensis]MBB4152971.1 antitoxin VapB [Sphingomonas jinjuensis]
MGNEYRAKVFKSGNSVAVRIPKALGLEVGQELSMREQNGKIELEKVDARPRKIDLTGIFGSIPQLAALGADDRAFDDRELDWDGKLLRDPR